MSSNASYLTQRLIDTCLREDLFGLVAKSQFTARAPANLTSSNYPIGQAWAIFSHPDFTLYLPVTPSYYMQRWVYGSANEVDISGWLIEKKDQFELQHDYHDWVQLLKACAHESSHPLLDGYLQELECAEEHKALCDNAFQQHSESLNQPISQLKHWNQKLLRADQIAS